jgi:tetratricopeptide (TPR) repeat protein
MPYKHIGPASNANTDAVVHLHLDQDVAHVGVYVSSPLNCRVTLHHKGNLLWQRELPLSPTSTLSEQVPLPAGIADHELTLRVINRANERELISYMPPRERNGEIPAPATPAADPSAIASNDELFLNGLHLEQYRHATYHPEDYYMEALRRDPHDSRCNNAMGLLLLRRGDFAATSNSSGGPSLASPVATPTRMTAKPITISGWHYATKSASNDAIDAFYQATWNAAWQDSAFFELACIAGCQQRLPQALDLVRQALRRNWSNHRARFVEISLLRRLERRAEAIASCQVALQLDPMDAGAANELVQLGESTTIAASLRWDIPKFEAIALDYMACGDYDMALGMCTMAPQCVR